MKIKLTSLAIIFSAAIGGHAYASDLDSDSATVRMNISQFAALTDLDDFVLTTTDTDGAANAVYSGEDSYHLESNSQVRVSLSGGDLSNGSDTVSTTYALDNDGLIMDTTVDVVHDGDHSVSAEATLGDISSQKAGAYSADITLTVSTL